VNYNYKSLQIMLNHVGKHCSFHHKTLWIATVFPTWFPPLFCVCFVTFFSKIISVEFFFNIEPIKNLALLFCFFKTLWIVAVFSYMIFLWFFSKLSLSIFFNIELVKNYNYNKDKSYEESVVVFLTKHCGLLQYFSK